MVNTGFIVCCVAGHKLPIVVLSIKRLYNVALSVIFNQLTLKSRIKTFKVVDENANNSLIAEQRCLIGIEGERYIAMTVI